MNEYIVDIIQSAYGEAVKRKQALIRCEDCKFYQPHEQYGFDEDRGEYHDYCELLVPDDTYYAYRVSEKHFCSWAERKAK